jgi:hypothetical protein
MPTSTRSIRSVAQRRRRRPPSRSSHVVAVVVNVVLLLVVVRLPEWRWPAFLTDRFSELLPLIVTSFLVTIAVHVVHLVSDADWFDALGNLLTSAIAFVVALRTWQVFPFDFSGSGVDWTLVVRTVLAFALAGTAISVVVETARLATALVRGRSQPPVPHP